MSIFRYISFAILATAFNLAVQYLFFSIYDGFLALYLSMSAGTISGLILKYALDKKYVFFHSTKSKKEESKNFILYSFFGLFTTFIFWIFEATLDYLFDAKYLGAVLGLAIGYVVKYFLDKKYVFVNKIKIQINNS